MFMLRNSIIILFLMFLAFGLSFGQFKDLSVEFGVEPTTIFGNKAATSSPRTVTADETLGGGFFGFQNAITLKTVWQLDSKGKFAIPFGLEYVFYRSLYRIPYTASVTFYLRHAIDIPTLTLGFRYNMFKLPFANVNAYTEFDVRGAFVGKSNYRVRIDYTNYDSVFIKDNSFKNAVSRFGTGLRLGFVGEVVHPWYVNIFAGVCYVNLLFKDDARGELLTPTNTNETKENPVYNFFAGFVIQYRFGK